MGNKKAKGARGGLLAAIFGNGQPRGTGGAKGWQSGRHAAQQATDARGRAEFKAAKAKARRGR